MYIPESAQILEQIAIRKTRPSSRMDAVEPKQRLSQEEEAADKPAPARLSRSPTHARTPMKLDHADGLSYVAHESNVSIYGDQASSSYLHGRAVGPASERAIPTTAWERGKRFGIVIDAGSSGSRIQVYSWLDHEVAKEQRLARGEGIAVLPRIQKGVEHGEGWTMKVEPGISSLADHPDGVDAYLQPLFQHAASIIPPSQLATTPVYLLATAGMRLLAPEQSAAILDKACRFIKKSTPFHVRSCEDQIRIISGEEEGIYGWVAVNYLMDGFDAHGLADKGKGRHSSTFGFLDMGGASTQIAFEPSTEARHEHADNLLSVNLRLLDGVDVHHPVFVTTWLGYGTNQARERYVDAAIEQHLLYYPVDESTDTSAVGSEKPMTIIEDPCLPRNLMLTEGRHPGYALRGTGSYAQCLAKSEPLLNREMPCPDKPCLMGVHVPPIDFTVNHFIGISEYWYSTQDLWSLGGVYDFPTFEWSAVEYCAQEWNDIIRDHAEGGSKVSPGHTPPDVQRLEMQCFKAAWITNVLHEGIGIPRLAVGETGQGRGNVTEEALRKAGEKGFAHAPPHFQSVNEINEVSVSWTLGRMVLEVTDSIPRSRKSVAHDEDEHSATPLFEWKSPHHNVSWLHRIGGNIQHAYSNTHPMAAIGLAILALLLLYYCAFKKRSGWFNRTAKINRDEYGLLSMEEGAHSSLDSRAANSPRKDSSALSRAFMPFRVMAMRINPLVQRPSQGQSRSFLPLSRSGSTPSVNGTLSTSARPAPNLRHVASSPALGRLPVQRASSLPTSSSMSKLRVDVSAMQMSSLESNPPPLTPPVRSTSPSWPIRASPNGGPRIYSHRMNGFSSNESDGYLTVPVGISSTTSSARESSISPEPQPFNGDEGIGLRSRNASFTNLGLLARPRNGHPRKDSVDLH